MKLSTYMHSIYSCWLLPTYYSVVWIFFSLKWRLWRQQLYLMVKSKCLVHKLLPRCSPRTAPCQTHFWRMLVYSLGAPQNQLHQLKGIFGNNLKLKDEPKLPSRNNLQHWRRRVRLLRKILPRPKGSWMKPQRQQKRPKGVWSKPKRQHKRTISSSAVSWASMVTHPRLMSCSLVPI